MKLTNQKNGYKNACIHHEANGEVHACPVRAVARRVIDIRANTNNPETFLAAYWDATGKRKNVSDANLRAALKMGATLLRYPVVRGIPIDRIDTHSLRGGGANALHLNGYSDREIQKMGRWRSDAFKEYISEHLSTFTEGMSKNMKRSFNFVNVEGGVLHNITKEVVELSFENEHASCA